MDNVFSLYLLQVNQMESYLFVLAISMIYAIALLAKRFPRLAFSIYNLLKIKIVAHEWRKNQPICYLL